MASETFNSSNQLQGSFRENFSEWTKCGEKSHNGKKTRAGKNYGENKKSINLMIQLSMNTPFDGGQAKNDSSLFPFIVSRIFVISFPFSRNCS